MPRLLGGLILVVLVAVGTATAASVPAFRWTPAQASAQLVRWNPAVYADDYTVGSARCGGRGSAIAGRYLQFRCAVTFQPRHLRDQPKAATLWVAVRKQGAGQPCVSLTSLASIPAGCLRTVGARIAGSLDDAEHAVEARTSTVQSPECVGFGAGFYRCDYQVGGEPGRAAVSFAPAKVSVTLL